jgi:hypothetical protein
MQGFVAMAGNEKKALVEGEDYTVDPVTGNWIFTAQYLERRGYCCESGCQNCPYGFRKTKP